MAGMSPNLVESTSHAMNNVIRVSSLKSKSPYYESISDQIPKDSKRSDLYDRRRGKRELAIHDAGFTSGFTVASRARDVGQDGGEATPVHLAHPSRNPLPACGLYRFWARVNGAPRHGKTGLYGARSIITYTPRTSR
ncbi:conserved hypothetical protein [Coccidioides posadasii str. Silveira]|uniref:Uncharacterized protein n=1 Tax=Coccidioides posadasii (strain RMSCC 757 / Silveira) TaxID=443226 RepID=E9DHJ7_COCPS|nr:conserved hypothetical protein [Coccidioides posadasii str. Silveira]